MMEYDLLVVSDLDGCLLDAKTYRHEAARPALAALARRGCPVVLCSGKTRAEMEVLALELGLAAPFIVENGGAIVFPPGAAPAVVPGAARRGSARVLALGAPRAMLVEALAEIAAAAGVTVRGFASLSPGEVAELTGLDVAMARLALQREHDEPFLIEGGGDLPALSRAAAARGLRLSHGGRFHHLSGDCDKGRAVRTLLALHEGEGRRYRSVGLGDAGTDVSLLQAVDRPILVPRPDGSLDPALVAALKDAECAPLPGPEGWNLALLAVLDGRELPRSVRQIVPRAAAGGGAA